MNKSPDKELRDALQPFVREETISEIMAKFKPVIPFSPAKQPEGVSL